MIWTVFHHVQALLDLVSERDVEYDGAEESCEDNWSVRSRFLEIFHSLITCDWFVSKEPDQNDLTKKHEPPLSCHHLTEVAEVLVKVGPFFVLFRLTSTCIRTVSRDFLYFVSENYAALKFVEEGESIHIFTKLYALTNGRGPGPARSRHFIVGHPQLLNKAICKFCLFFSLLRILRRIGKFIEIQRVIYFGWEFLAFWSIWGILETIRLVKRAVWQFD